MLDRSVTKVIGRKSESWLLLTAEALVVQWRHRQVLHLVSRAVHDAHLLGRHPNAHPAWIVALIAVQG